MRNRWLSVVGMGAIATGGGWLFSHFSGMEFIVACGIVLAALVFREVVWNADDDPPDGFDGSDAD